MSHGSVRVGDDQKASLDATPERRRERDWQEACERLGLSRQLRLKCASSHYPRAAIRDFTEKLKGEGKRFEFELGTCPTEPHRLNLYAYGRDLVAQINTVERLNAIIPYPVLLALETADELGCFDRFAIMAPLSRWGIEPGNSDPILLGVVEAPTANPHHAVYFEIASWR